MVGTSYYYDKIVMTLKGKTPEFKNVPHERLDWSGSGAVLDIYEKTSGQERDDIIRAIGQIVAEGKQPPAIIAQVLHIAASLDIAQIEPSVKQLKAQTIASEEPVRSAITNYLAFRQVRTHN